MKATDKQYEKAVKLYEDGGATAVYDYAKDIGIDEWSICFACETDTPDCKDGSCLVCGSVKTKQLTYWVSIQTGDSPAYNLIAKTKKECLQILRSNDWGPGYAAPVKRTVEYEDAFDLLDKATQVGANLRC